MGNATVAQLETWQSQMSTYLGGNDNTSATVDQLYAWKVKFEEWLDKQTPPPSTGGMPKTRMGVHWIPGQVRQGDLSYMASLKPGAIKVVSLDPARYKQALACLDPSPQSVIVARDHPLSEEKDFMRSNPVACGKAHALSWHNKFVSGGSLASLDPKNFLFCGINEPPLSNAAEEEIVAAYTKAYLTDMADYGLRCLVFNFSTGWPRNADTATVKNTKPIWNAKLTELEDLINATNSYIGLHEYWRDKPSEGIYTAPNGERWGWNAYRHLAMPMNCRIVIGECGLTKEVNGSPAPGQSKGWVGNVSPETYAAQLWEYAEGCSENVLAVMPFTTNFESADWREDDTSGAHSAILARKQTHVWPDVWPVDKGGGETPPEEEPMLIVFPKFTGKISGFYGQDYGNYSHEGMDLGLPTGTPIYAPIDSVVAYAGVDTLYGNYVRLFSSRLKTCFFYAHLSELNVKNGDNVKQGQLLGKTGSSGNSSAPHLHFEIRGMTDAGAYRIFKDGQALFRQNGRLDPLGWLVGWQAAGNTYEER